MRSTIAAVAAGVGFLVVIVLFFLINPLVTVASNERGVVLDWGAFNGQILDPGIHWRTPFKQRVVKVDVQEQSLNVDASDAYTKEGQPVKIRSSLLYSIDPRQVGDLYVNLGLNYEAKIVQPVVEEAVKGIIAKYAAIDIPSNRGQIAGEIETAIRANLTKRYLTVEKYTLVNEDFADSYEQAIVAEQTKEQEAKTAEQQTKVAEQQKQQAILEAQGQAESIRIQAEALAKNPDLVKLKAVEKWSGQLPQYMIPGATLPFLGDISPK